MYLREVDSGKGLAMMLVVSGHLISADLLLQYPVYHHFRCVIYAFHIPFFYFLAGITFGVSLERSSDYSSFIYKKAARILMPYLFYASIVFLGKFIFSNYDLYVTNSVSSLDDFINIILAPNRSYAEYLWFIYVLFLFYLTVPLFMKLIKSYYAAIGCVIVFAFLLPDTLYFGLKNYKYNLVFFLMGFLAYKNYNSFIKFISRFGFICTVIFILSLAFYSKISNFLIALFSIPSLYYVIVFIFKERVKLFNTIGKVSFSIYLMHMIIIGTVTSAIFKLTGEQSYGLTSLLLLFMVGIVGPVLIKIKFVDKVKKLQWILG